MAKAQNVVELNAHNASPCLACTKRSQCPAAGRESAVRPTQRLVQSGATVYEAGTRFDGIYIVRSGFLKSYSIDSDGVMQVTGFHLPGEFFGMDGIESGTYGDHVEALDTTSVCRIPLELFGETNADGESLMLPLVKLMSRTIAGDRRMFFTLGKMSARRRVGVFLKELSERMARSGYSATEFMLCMSRTDIANYLCLALETVSRLMTQLHNEGVIDVERRRIRLLDMAALVQDSASPEKIRKAG
jgi:CRP/FNR family transcriptional regulator